MIRQDRLSKLLIVLAVMILLFLATFQPTAIILFPTVLLICGVGMERFLERKREETDDGLEQASSRTKILYYTAIAVGGFILVSHYVTHFELPMQLTSYDAVMYSVLIAVAEEQFFRGFITDFLLTYYSNADSPWRRPIVALVLSAVIGGAYHLARYGSNFDSLMYVVGGFFILNWVAYKSKRLSPGMLAHISNNLYSVMQVI